MHGGVQGEGARLHSSHSRGSLGRSGSGGMQRQGSQEGGFHRQGSFHRQASVEGGPPLPRQNSNVSELSRQQSVSSMSEGPHRCFISDSQLASTPVRLWAVAITLLEGGILGFLQGAAVPVLARLCQPPIFGWCSPDRLYCCMRAWPGHHSPWG